MTFEVEKDVGQILAESGNPIDKVAREMIVSGLYARGRISSTRASALLGITPLAFMRRMKLGMFVRSPRLIAVGLGGTCATALLLNIGLLVKMPGHHHLGSYLLICSIVGGLLGWTVAVLASPTQKEKEDFATYAKIISGFLTAYLFVKLDPIIMKLLNDESLRTEEVAVRLAYGFAFFLIGLMWTFLVRRYTEAPSNE